MQKHKKLISGNFFKERRLVAQIQYDFETKGVFARVLASRWGKGMDGGGVKVEVDKIENEENVIASPATLVLKGIPIEVFDSGNFENAAGILMRPETKMLAGWKKDVGTDRLRKLSEEEEYKEAIETKSMTDEKLSGFIHQVVEPQRVSPQTMEDIKEKVIEMRGRAQGTVKDRSTKQVLGQYLKGFEKCKEFQTRPVSTEEVGEIEEYLKHKEIPEKDRKELTKAIKKLKSITEEKRTLYLKRSIEEAGNAQGSFMDFKYVDVEILGHNECLLYPEIQDIYGIFVKPHPDSLAQAQEIQTYLKEHNGGIELPILYYNPELGRLISLSENGLKFVCGMSESLESIDQGLEEIKHIDKALYVKLIEVFRLDGFIREKLTKIETEDQKIRVIGWLKEIIQIPETDGSVIDTIGKILTELQTETTDEELKKEFRELTVECIKLKCMKEDTQERSRITKPNTWMMQFLSEKENLKSVVKNIENVKPYFSFWAKNLSTLEMKNNILEIAVSETEDLILKENAFKLILKSLEKEVLDTGLRDASEELKSVINRLLVYCDEVIFRTATNILERLPVTTETQLHSLEGGACNYHFALQFFNTLKTFTRQPYPIPVRGLTALVERVSRENEGRVDPVESMVNTVLVKQFSKEKVREILTKYIAYLEEEGERLPERSVWFIEKFIAEAYSCLGKESISEDQLYSIVQLMLRQIQPKSEQDKEWEWDKICTYSKTTPFYKRITEDPIWVYLSLEWAPKRNMRYSETDKYGLTTEQYANLWGKAKSTPLIKEFRRPGRRQLSVDQARQVLIKNRESSVPIKEKAKSMQNLVVYLHHLRGKASEKSRAKYQKFEQIILNEIEVLKAQIRDQVI